MITASSLKQIESILNDIKIAYRNLKVSITELSDLIADEKEKNQNGTSK
jgi:hypothetical protein